LPEYLAYLVAVEVREEGFAGILEGEVEDDDEARAAPALDEPPTAVGVRLHGVDASVFRVDPTVVEA
jgi:hypothetical protein